MHSPAIWPARISGAASNRPLWRFEQTVLTEREYVNLYRSNLWTKSIVIDLFERAKLVGLLGYPDLLDIVWREKEPFPGSISYLHQARAYKLSEVNGWMSTRKAA